MGKSSGRLEGKVVIITGAARGFGEGIALLLAREGASLALVDIDENGLKDLADRIAADGRHAVPLRCDVTDQADVKAMVAAVVSAFGRIDCLISNAGIISAGGLDTMTPERFDEIAKVNYKGYYLLVKEVAPVMKTLTAAEGKDSYADIIQINSKSGLVGSKANFAYAGSKFAGIGLTQSFALELAPFRIKVNSICPGNYYDSPLWSDPDDGLFVQYLKAGKIPGAKTVEDVRRHYIALTPLSRGCTPEDVVVAIMYVIEQKFETGQAIPVTGGQIMLG